MVVLKFKQTNKKQAIGFLKSKKRNSSFYGLKLWKIYPAKLIKNCKLDLLEGMKNAVDQKI